MSTDENLEVDDGVKKEVVKGAVELARAGYTDALQPGSKELGKSLGTLGQLVNVALDPFRGFIWAYDKFKQQLIADVEQALEVREVPEERVTMPNPDVAIPSIEALRYSRLSDRYVALLATAMDSETANDAHPSYVEILKQLTPDEARIIDFMPTPSGFEPVANLVCVLPEGAGVLMATRNLSLIAMDAACEHPENDGQYIDNLCRLGLLYIPEGKALMAGSAYDRLEGLKYSQRIKASVEKTGEFQFEPGMIGITELGHCFRRACSPDPTREDWKNKAERPE